MRILKLLIPALLLAGSAHAETASVPLPKDVTTFLENRDTCNQFVNEEPHDDARRKELEQKTAQYCDDLDENQKALEKKYKGNKTVINAIGTEELED